MELGLIFTNERGALIQQHRSQLYGRRQGTRQRTRQGYPDWVTPHDLRHYFASVLIRSGASIKVVQARLGHASAMKTIDIYVHLFADEEDRTRAAIDKELSTPASSARPDETRFLRKGSSGTSDT